MSKLAEGSLHLIRILIAEWQQQGILKKKQASDHRKMIRDIVKKEMKSKGNEFIAELDKKIKQAVRFFDWKTSLILDQNS